MGGGKFEPVSETLRCEDMSLFFSVRKKLWELRQNSVVDLFALEVLL
jgi:hypothetical protein